MVSGVFFKKYKYMEETGYPHMKVEIMQNLFQPILFKSNLIRPDAEKAHVCWMPSPSSRFAAGVWGCDPCVFFNSTRGCAEGRKCTFCWELKFFVEKCHSDVIWMWFWCIKWRVCRRGAYDQRKHPRFHRFLSQFQKFQCPGHLEHAKIRVAGQHRPRKLTRDRIKDRDSAGQDWQRATRANRIIYSYWYYMIYLPWN